MRFNISSKTLMNHLSAVSKVVNSKNTITILDNFLFDLKGEELVITGSDSDTTLKTRIVVNDAEGEGKFAVNAKRLNELLKELPEQGLKFEIDDNNLEINIYYMNGKFNFIGINGNEFPQKALNDSDSLTFAIPAKEIVKGINQTIFAVGTEDLRPVMMGILWDIKPEEIVFVASDTHKLVRYKNFRTQTGLEASFILPTKPASIIANIFAKEAGNVAVTIDSKCATFTTEDYTLNCRFVNGKYPKYNSVIPVENPNQLSIDRETLLAAIRRVSVFASQGGLIKFEFRQNEIFLKAEDVDYSTLAEETIPCDYSGDNLIMGFNKTRIIEVLDNINNDTVTIMLSDSSRAGIFEPEKQEEGEDLLVLLMPMMI
ncbi:MAG: DNA polymerase III subunit beta [Bacteroidales bacterium]|nr:DNA polymerase III subunit beta [Bacteroidales bacterium]